MIMDAVSEWADFKGALKVKLKIFEGPLDLLFHLIRNSKIDIYDIPMAEITAQYLEYLDIMKDLDLDVASEFLIMAATLTHIKSRMLLPVSEEEEVEDPRFELVQQLLEYQRYKEASRSLEEMHSKRGLLFTRATDTMTTTQEEVFLDVSLFELLKVFREVISTAKEGPVLNVVPEKYSVVDKMRSIAEMIEMENKLIFKNIFQDKAPKGEVITAFLAVLELVRLRMIRLIQEEPGGEIIIIKMAA